MQGVRTCTHAWSRPADGLSLDARVVSEIGGLNFSDLSYLMKITADHSVKGGENKKKYNVFSHEKYRY